MQRSFYLAAALVGSAVFLSFEMTEVWAQARDFWGDPVRRGFRYEPPNLMHLRAWAIILSGLAGLALGWFLSPQAAPLRKMLLLVAAGLLVVITLADNGWLGWGLTPFTSLAAFAAGLGYWLGQRLSALAKRFREVPTTFGSAAWATFGELLAYGAITLNGFRLGFVRDGEGALQPLSYDSDRHGLLVGPTRSQKGTSVIVPNLLTYPGSMMVIDPKGENAMITAEHRRAMGQDVHVVDPFGITGLEASCYNPLDWLVHGGVDRGDNSLLTADSIIMMESKNEPFFDHSAKAALDGFNLYVATDEQEEGQRHLGRVRDLLMLDGEELITLFKRMLASPHHKVRTTGASLLQKDPKLLSNIMASIQAQTNFLDSPSLRESLSRSDFSFEDLKTKPMTIYIVLPADRIVAYGRHLRLLVQQALTVNARNIAMKPDHPVMFILDELPALGKLNMVEQAFGLMAGFSMRLVGVCQDLSQLKSIYGDGWETFISNAGMIQYFGSRDRFTAEYFSALCGKTTVWDLSTGMSRALGVTRGETTSRSDTTTTSDNVSAKSRQLAYADELMRMPRHKQLVFIDDQNPIIAEKQPWFKNPELKDLGVNLYPELTEQTDEQFTQAAE